MARYCAVASPIVVALVVLTAIPALAPAQRSGGKPRLVVIPQVFRSLPGLRSPSRFPEMRMIPLAPPDSHRFLKMIPISGGCRMILIAWGATPVRRGH